MQPLRNLLKVVGKEFAKLPRQKRIKIIRGLDQPQLDFVEKFFPKLYAEAVADTNRAYSISGTLEDWRRHFQSSEGSTDADVRVEIRREAQRMGMHFSTVKPPLGKIRVMKEE